MINCPNLFAVVKVNVDQWVRVGDACRLISHPFTCGETRLKIKEKNRDAFEVTLAVAEEQFQTLWVAERETSNQVANLQQTARLPPPALPFALENFGLAQHNADGYLVYNN